jgi:hypothetical protein
VGPGGLENSNQTIMSGRPGLMKCPIRVVECTNKIQSTIDPRSPPNRPVRASPKGWDLPRRKIPCSLDKIPCSCKKIPCSVEQGICS